MEVSFLYPRFLILLLLVPFFVFVYFFSIIYNKKKATVFGNFEAMERFYDLEFFSKNFLALYFNLIIIVLLVLSLSGMAVTFNANTSAFSFVVAIDSSGSMSTTDVSPNRLSVAKNEAKKFVDLLPIGVEVGVISFSGDALVLQELDNSRIRVKSAIDLVSFGEVSGTNIYNAVVSANKIFGARELKSVILISDGQLNVGETTQVISFLERNNLVVNTIAIGTLEGGTGDLNTISKVDEDFLKAIAFNSGGRFFRIGSDGELSDSLNILIEETSKDVKIELDFYFLIVVIALFSIMWILYNLRFKVIP